MLLDVRVSFFFPDLHYMYMNDLMNDNFPSVSSPIGNREKLSLYCTHSMCYI